MGRCDRSRVKFGADDSGVLRLRCAPPLTVLPTSLLGLPNLNFLRLPGPPPTASQHHSLVSQPAKYICEVVCECKPPASVSYNSFPFFTLRVGEFYDILQEAGHTNIHPGLPLSVDDEGEDCLLLCRDGSGLVGWALASFSMPSSPRS